MSHVSRREVLKLGGSLLAVPALSGFGHCSPVLAADPPKAVKPKVDPYADAKFVAGPPPKPAKGSFTIVVLPDTQHYSEKFPDNYYAQTRWIVEQQQARNIGCVFHLGDITNHNTPAEWDVATQAMHALDGRLPYFMVCGNHDYSTQGVCSDRTTSYNQAFPLARYRDRTTFGGTYDKEPDRYENCYHLIELAGRKFLILCLEFGPRNDVVRWAGEIAARHADREAVLLTHAYMYYDDHRYDWAQYGKQQTWNPHSYKVAINSADDVNDGEQLWQKLVGKHENFILTLNGHVLNDGLGRTVTPTAAGRDVNQVLVNFQMKPNGGDGWLRLLEFRDDGQTVEVYDYSPVLDRWNESPQNRFTMRTARVLS